MTLGQNGCPLHSLFCFAVRVLDGCALYVGCEREAMRAAWAINEWGGKEALDAGDR